MQSLDKFWHNQNIQRCMFKSVKLTIRNNSCQWEITWNMFVILIQSPRELLAPDNCATLDSDKLIDQLEIQGTLEKLTCCHRISERPPKEFNLISFKSDKRRNEKMMIDWGWKSNFKLILSHFHVYVGIIKIPLSNEKWGAQRNVMDRYRKSGSFSHKKLERLFR